jgi:hypothetical protein
LKRGSTSVSYLARRLKRDRPDIAARIDEFPSMRQAAIAAGIVRPPDPFPRDLPAMQEDAPEEHAAFEYFIGSRRKRHRWPTDHRQPSG